MSTALPPCPACQSAHTVKNGKIHNGKQNFKCRECGRQFVQDPQNKSIDQATKTLIDKLLLEKIPLAGIQEWWVFQSLGSKTMSMSNMRWCPSRLTCRLKKTTLAKLAGKAFKLERRKN